jgi:hypothetical protein
MLRETDWMNPTTGEVASGLLVVRGARYPKGMDFLTIFANGLTLLANSGLTATDWRVLAVLMFRLDYGNAIEVSQGTIAEQLEIKQPNVNRSIRRLVELRVITRARHPENARRIIYGLNVSVGWKGRAGDWAKVAHGSAPRKRTAPAGPDCYTGGSDPAASSELP